MERSSQTSVIGLYSCIVSVSLIGCCAEAGDPRLSVWEDQF